MPERGIVFRTGLNESGLRLSRNASARQDSPFIGDQNRESLQRLSRSRRCAAEAIGTGFLLIAVVGSGILAERLANGNVALTLLANSLATGAALFALIEWLGPISGAHLNPLVTAALALRRDVDWTDVWTYGAAQIVGAVMGVVAAHAMFDAPLVTLSSRARSGPGQWLSEFVATFGLIGIVWVCSRTSPRAVGGIVAAFIGGAFWFTATDFANPAVTIARALTDTFTGIRPRDVGGFIAAELAGAATACAVCSWMTRSSVGASRRDARLTD